MNKPLARLFRFARRGMKAVFYSMAVLHVKGTVIEMPADIDPVSTPPDKDFGTTSGINGGGFAVNASFEKCRCSKNCRVAKELIWVTGNSSRINSTPCFFNSFVSAIRCV